MKSFNIFFVKEKKNSDICFLFIFLTYFSKAIGLKLIEYFTVFKVVHQVDQLTDCKLALLCQGVFIDHFEAESLGHVLLAVETI